ncbi:hypothetical protein [Sporichthya polymorpha]|uniref:hypothetical protein n=1 Tax=Sporichthya polymorpha TaxID=35751 RepID=UPI0003610C57|nr:hypothetical protein [Sporichthya polymorpha]
MRSLRRACGSLVAVLVLLGLALGLTSGLPGGPARAATADEPTAARVLFPRGAPAPDVIFVGVPGLRWSDIQGAIPTPALWLLARESSLGALAVRTVEPTSCPVDGWLTLNSGARAVGPRPDRGCGAVPAPRGTGTRATIPGWAELVAPNGEHSYDPVWGTLARARPGAVAPPPAERCAVGPGAAVALADGTGAVHATYAADFADLPRTACSELLLVDAGPLPAGPTRLPALRQVDELIGQIRAEIPDSALIVAGIADSDPDEPHLTAIMVEAGADSLRGLRRGWLRSDSTRRTGTVTITDLTPTLIGDAIPPDLDGHRLQYRPRIESTPSSVRELEQRDIAARVMSDIFVWFFAVLIAGQLLLYLGVWLARRSGADRRSCARVLRGVGLTFGAVPAAAVLANLLPWRASDHPAVALWVLIAAGAGAIAATAAGGPWRRAPYGAATAVAVVTAGTFGLDVMFGSRLQMNNPFGLSPLIAGRFYGFGNIAFAVFAVCALVAAAGGAAALIRRGRPEPAAVVVLVVGAIAALVDGWPRFGADFGGVIALVPGVALLAAGVAGIRVTVGRALAVGALAVALAAAIAVLDWRRGPGSRSHLGSFVQDVVDGEGLDVIGRKLDANLGLLVDAPIIVAAAVPLTVLAVLTLLRPTALGLDALARAQAADPVLRPLMLACLTTALIGFAVNDSGVIVPAVALLAAGPLLVAIWANLWVRERA